MHWPAVWLSSLMPAVCAVQAAKKTAEYIVEHEYETTRQADQAVREYWTPERIFTMQHDHYSTLPPDPIPSSAIPLGAEYTSGGVLRHAIGRLFYTEPEDDGADTDYSCSATLVESANKATIVTAAHCIKRFGAILNGTKWSYNHLFVPGYRDDIPKTNFTLNRAFLESGWVANRNFSENFFADRAYAVLNPDPATGKSAGEISGHYMKVGFGLDETSYDMIYDFGYPRSVDDDDMYRNGTPAFTGRRLAYCTGKAAKWWRFPSDLAGLPCLMGGGCSGGPSFVDFDAGRGIGKIVAVNSISDLSNANRTGPVYLYSNSITDEFSKRMYERAQAALPVWRQYIL